MKKAIEARGPWSAVRRLQKYLAARIRLPERGELGSRRAGPLRGRCRIVFGLLPSAFCLAVSAQFAINWHTMDSGGGTSSGGAFRVTGTIGQPDAGTLAGGNYQILGGYWGLITVVQTPEAPRLSIRNDAGRIQLFWDRTFEGWTLQEATSLQDNPIQWRDLSANFYEAGDTQWIYTVDPPSQHQCYRLYKN